LSELLEFYGKQKFVCFCYLVLVFISTLLFASGYLFYLSFVVTINGSILFKCKVVSFNLDHVVLAVLCPWSRDEEIYEVFTIITRMPVLPSEEGCGVWPIQVSPPRIAVDILAAAV